MAGMLRMPRTRGAVSGLLLVLLGIWGGLAIFVGPAFGYGYGPDRTWAYNTDRLYMVVLPAAATLLGGLLVLFSANRATAIFGGWLAALGGAWFVLAGPLAPIWHGTAANPAGTPLGGSPTTQALEQLVLFSGLGVVIVFLAAFSLGRFTVRGAREVAAAEAERTLAEPATPAGYAGYSAGRMGEPDDVRVASTQDLPPVTDDTTETGGIRESGTPGAHAVRRDDAGPR